MQLVANVLRLGEEADFTTNVDAENQTLIHHKCVCGVLNRHFCQTPCWRLVLCHISFSRASIFGIITKNYTQNAVLALRKRTLTIYRQSV